MSASLEGDRSRILLLGPLAPPHVVDQAVAMKDRGFDVHVGGDAEEVLHDPTLERAGIPVHSPPVARRRTPLGMLATGRWIRALAREIEPDVVSAHWLPSFGFAAAIAGARPLALTAWGTDIYEAGRLMRFADRYALRRADLVMADADNILDECVALGANRARTANVQWGVDLSLFGPGDRAAAKRSLGLGPGPVVMSPRSFMPVYNIPTIIEAFGRVGDEFPDAQLVLKHIGTLQIELPELPHPDRVHVIGRVPYERMADYYRAADIVVSLTSADATPRTVWEAMACGCAVVVSDLPWVRDRLEPGRDVRTVPVDAGALAATILDLLREPDVAERMATAGRRLIERELDRDGQMDRLAGLYRDVATGKGVR
jgi:glycosyltransferase involved in cell wall biosynthesis